MFEQTLKKRGLSLCRDKQVTTLQVNLGKLCNQACLHCHVEAGPKRTEIMERKTMDRILELLERSSSIQVVDLTGGAPEMNPHFRDFVVSLRATGRTVIDRCNLTIFFEEGYEDLPGFLREHRVQVVASLPCYSKENVEKQRGRGVFNKSIQALKILNQMGYGQEGTGLELHLVYNPGGAFLPPDQKKLEADYKRELRQLFEIEFNQLYTITNVPIKRFLVDLERTGKKEEYMGLLKSHFNPEAAKSIMCRHLISVSWDGQLYDCDFNQMLELERQNGQARNLWDLESFEDISEEKIAFAEHCFACTAGSGSSCGGALV
ncbi:MAG: radical SAM/Cys-rich domain protein [Bdellovibrio sp.]|nr:MAG: radical SAM/Cys-rich domain protein [Bdellovibrio sp.]